MDRFSFDSITRQLFNAAVRIGVCDAVDLGCLMAEHGTDAAAILARLGDYADARQHDTDSNVRALWFGAVEAIAWHRDNDAREAAGDVADPFGFRAAARERANAALQAAGVAR